jgi:hypothetical protein
MHDSAINARVLDIVNELSSKGVSEARVKELSAEMDRLGVQRRTNTKAAGYASYASPAEWDGTANPGGFNDGTGGPELAFKGFGSGLENRIRPTSMYSMDKAQANALQQAARQRTPMRVEIGSKGLEHGFMGLRDKAAVTEGGLTPNLLPPVQQMGERGWYGIPYELTRVANFLPNIAFNAPGVAYWRHDSNGQEAAYTAEAGTKPDLTPVITEQYVRPAKVAGRINLTHELVQDAGDVFASHLVTDLARSVYNAESNLLLNGTTSGNGFNGLNQVSGVLTQAYNGTNDVDQLDTLSKAFVKLRQDFFEPDLAFISPATMGALRRLRDANHRPQLDLLAGARAIDQTSEQETLWGVPVVQTTQQADGTAAILSVKNGAAVVYVREALTTFFDPYSQAASNIYQFIAETRLALAVPRPGAICLVTGLPDS